MTCPRWYNFHRMNLRRWVAGWLAVFCLTLLVPGAEIAIHCLKTGAVTYGADADGCHLQEVAECEQAFHTTPCCRVQWESAPAAEAKRPLPSVSLAPSPGAVGIAPVFREIVGGLWIPAASLPYRCLSGLRPPLRAPPFVA
jgi:hypothetical protein